VPDELIGRTATPKGGLFILAPFSNRIRAGRLQFRGERHALEPHPDSAPDASHGYANRLPWRVVRQARESVELALDDWGGRWPWRLALEQRIGLVDGALEMRLAAVSRDARPMPIGLGFHPFFSRTGGQRLKVRAERVRATHADTRPTTSAPLDGPLDASLDPWAMGRYLEGWDGKAEITLPTLDAAVTMTADPSSLPYLLTFTPPGRPVVCVEPVSHLTGAMELADAAAEAQGVRVLAPGGRLEVELRLAPRLTLA
jgi:aldose 1-epimerase